MKKQLNIKSLAKGMRAKDKAKLLFADRNKRAETLGQEGLLSPEEEKAIISDAQDLNQIGEINRLNRLFDMASLICLDIQTAYLNFKVAEGRLITIVAGIVLVGRAMDISDKILYDLTTESQKVEKLRQKYYGKGGLLDLFDYFEPSSNKPNLHLQKAFMHTIKKIKDYKKQAYQCDYVISKAGIELLGNREKKGLKDFNKEVNSFINLEGYLSVIKMYGVFEDKGLIKKTNLSEPGFLKAIKDMKKTTSLSTEEKDKLQEEIDNQEQTMLKYN